MSVRVSVSVSACVCVCLCDRSCVLLLQWRTKYVMYALLRSVTNISNKRKWIGIICSKNESRVVCLAYGLSAWTAKATTFKCSFEQKHETYITCRGITLISPAKAGDVPMLIAQKPEHFTPHNSKTLPCSMWHAQCQHNKHDTDPCLRVHLRNVGQPTLVRFTVPAGKAGLSL